MKKVRETYARQAMPLGVSKLNLLDLKLDDIKDIKVNDKVEDWFTIKHPSELLIKKGVKSGDKFLAFRSLRYTMDELKKEIPRVFPNYSIFDTEGPFVGFLLKKT